MMDAAIDCASVGDLADTFGRGTVGSMRRNADAPLVGLEGSDLSARFRHWRGASGRRYLFSVFPLRSISASEGCPRYREAVILAVARSDNASSHARETPNES